MSHQHSEMLKEFEEYILEDIHPQRAHEKTYHNIMDIVDSIKSDGIEVKPINKYQRKVPNTTIDVYDVLIAFEVNNPATAHAVKKLLASGKRGYKDVIQDLQEAIQSIERAIELESN